MKPPDESLCEEVASSIAGWDVALSYGSNDENLGNLLDHINLKMSWTQQLDLADATLAVEDATLAVEDAEDELASINAWAGLISYAVARTYAPVGSSWSQQRGGWPLKITKKLQGLIRLLRPRMEAIAKALHAAHFSISVSFPWGISVGLSF